MIEDFWDIVTSVMIVLLVAIIAFELPQIALALAEALARLVGVGI